MAGRVGQRGRGAGRWGRGRRDSGGGGRGDADGGIQAEAAGGPPGEHVGDGVRVEQAAAEEAEHAALNGALERVGVVGSQVRRFIEADGPVARLGEEAVEDDEVEVEVGVEGGAEAVQEGDGAQLGVRPGAGAGWPRWRTGWWVSRAGWWV